MRNRILIIAEAGVNHNGRLATAKRLIDAAAWAGADVIKFQTFNAESLVSKFAAKAEYQKKNSKKGETHLEMIKRLQLDSGAHKELLDYCSRKGIMFLSSPFDMESIELLDRLGLRIFKIPSGEITNFPYLKKIGSLRKKVIISTGMSDLKEVRAALDILVNSGTPKKNITVLHCIAQYPAQMCNVNLKAMGAINGAFGTKVGYSDHTLGIEVAIAAAALGAAVIEKHFTLDKNMKGPDHKMSVVPEELKAMVQAIRNIERALGDGMKRPSKSEETLKKIVRKSIVACVDIDKGARITVDMLTIKRPGNGLEPRYIGRIIGRKASRFIAQDSLIRPGDLR